MNYEKPMMEIIRLEFQNVIMTSGGVSSGAGGDGPVNDLGGTEDF